MKKYRFKKITAAALAVLLICTSAPLYSFAGEESTVTAKETLPEAAPAQAEASLAEGTPAPAEETLPEGTSTPAEVPLPEETPTPTEVPLPEETPAPTEAPLPEGTPAVPEATLPETAPAPIGSDGSLAGQVLCFVNLSWEEWAPESVTAVFGGGTNEEVQAPMEAGARGKYRVSIPEGDYDTVRFLTSGAEDGGAVTQAYNYYGMSENPADNLSFAPQRMDTCYYDSREESSYWGADALYEDREITPFALGTGYAGRTVYFVPLPAQDGEQSVTRVRLNFYAGDYDETSVPDAVCTMYEGRENIYSAPLLPLADGLADTYSHLSFTVEYEDGEVLASCEFSYETTRSDTYFYNSSRNSGSYWGAHPAVADRALTGQYLYVDAEDKNGDGLAFLEDSIVLTYEKSDGTVFRENLTEWAEGDTTLFYVFPGDCQARESTVLTVEGTLRQEEAETVKILFYYSLNTERNMLVADKVLSGEPFFDVYEKPQDNPNGHGDDSREVPEAVFEKEPDTYYTTATVYDYYSNGELGGKTVKKNKEYRTDQGETFNRALSAYFKDTGSESVTPLYLNRQNSNKNDLYRYDKAANTWFGSLDAADKPAGVNNASVVQGLADEQLSGGQLTMDGMDAPYFDEDFLRGENSLGINLGCVYSNVRFPFLKNETGYWEFDSLQSDQSLRLSEDADRGYFLKRTGKAGTLKLNASGGLKPAYCPFNDPEDQEKRDGAIITKDNREKRKINYLFGNRFDIPFTLPAGNKIQMEEGADAVPVTFEFSGDDDAWVFVDGELLLDMGGIHDAVTGKIDFEAGIATVIQTDKGGDKVKPFALDPTVKKHTLTMFYMERGLGTSNLKLIFNFPLANTLDITNHIDTSGAADVFDEALAGFGGFNYQIQNQAVTGQPLLPEDSAGYISSVDSLAFNPIDENGAGVSIRDDDLVTSEIEGQGKDHSNCLSMQSKGEDLTAGASEEDIFAKAVTVHPQQGAAANGGAYAYLRMEVYSQHADRAGESLFVAMADENGNRMGGWADALAYDIGNNGLEAGSWNLVRLDFNKMQLLQSMAGDALSGSGSPTFDRTNIVSVQVTSGDTGTKRLDNLAFYAAVAQVPRHGFSVSAGQISDYGSLLAGTLTDAAGAWYSHYNSAVGSQAKYNMVSGGQFGLASGQKAEFLDKFRVGSYLHLREQADPKIFDTVYTVLDNGNIVPENALLASRTDTDTIKNTGAVQTLSRVSGTSPEDGRISVNEKGIEKPADNNALVYRSYGDPDNDAGAPVHLTVKYENVLKTGSVTINKELRFDDPVEGMNALGTKYVFDLHFNRIAGQVALEQDLVVPLTVTITEDAGDGTYRGSAVFFGIPAGTDYRIYEQATGGARLGTLEAGVCDPAESPHEDVTITGEEGRALYVSKAVAYESNQPFTFGNTVYPFYMDIEKVWNDAGYTAGRPEQIQIQIQRKTVQTPEDESAWEPVSYDYDGDGSMEPYLTLSGEGDTWAYHMKPDGGGALPLTDESGNAYEYRIREFDDEEYLSGLPEGTEKNRLLSYVNRYTVTSEGVYRVTNTPCSLTVIKRWADNNDPARPVEIRVQLYREAEGYDRAKYKDPIRISVNSRWRYTCKGIDVTAPNGALYTYSVVEEAVRYSRQGLNDWIAALDDVVNGYQIRYSPDNLTAGDEGDSSILTVINTKDTADVILKKIDSENEEKVLKGAKFLLQRLQPRDMDATEKETEFIHGGYNDKLWMVNQSYTEAEYTTGEDGRIEVRELPYGMYRITELLAPDGYYSLEQPIDFEISQTVMESVAEQYPGMTVKDAVLTVTVKNHKKMTLPTAGAGGTTVFAIAGLTLCGAGLLLYKKTRKERKV